MSNIPPIIDTGSEQFIATMRRLWKQNPEGAAHALTAFANAEHRRNRRVEKYFDNFMRTSAQLTDSSRLVQQNEKYLVSRSYQKGLFKRRGIGMGFGGILQNVIILMDVEDYDLRVRLAAGPSVLATMYRREMSSVGYKVFHGPVTKRIPVRRPRRSQYQDSYGRIRRAWIRAPRAAKGVGNLRKSFRVYGTLERLVISIGGKFSFYAAAIEYGSRSHFTTYRSPTAKHAKGHPIRRWAGGGFHPGFKGYRPLEMGVREGLPYYIAQHNIMHRQFVNYLASGSLNHLLTKGGLRKARAGGLVPYPKVSSQNMIARPRFERG